MTALRLVLLSVVIALGTIVAGWWTVPLVGLAYGAISRSSRFPGLLAAAAGALAWGGYLSVLGLGGLPVGSFAARVAASMSLPAAGVALATIVFPAILAGLSAYLGARVRPAPPDSLRRAA